MLGCSPTRDTVIGVTIGTFQCMMSSLNTTIIETSTYSQYSGIHQGRTLNRKFKQLYKIINMVFWMVTLRTICSMITHEYVWITRLGVFWVEGGCGEQWPMAPFMVVVFWVEGGCVSYDPWYALWGPYWVGGGGSFVCTMVVVFWILS